ncbi:hypothetical protein [Streptomyces sp. NPDC058867]|uniref:hypothetical protein n=1 Tax=unclassified Streptomyces TaxID=2593676 RepID=UPI003686FA3E
MSEKLGLQVKVRGKREPLQTQWVKVADHGQLREHGSGVHLTTARSRHGPRPTESGDLVHENEQQMFTTSGGCSGRSVIER